MWVKRKWEAIVCLMLYYKKNVYSKQDVTCFLIYSTTFIIQKIWVQNKRGRGFFLVYLSWIKRLMFYYEKCVFKASGLLPSLFFINQHCTPNVLLLKIWKASVLCEFYKTAIKEWFLNYKELPQTAAFSLFIDFHETKNIRELSELSNILDKTYVNACF